MEFKSSNRDATPSDAGFATRFLKAFVPMGLLLILFVFVFSYSDHKIDLELIGSNEAHNVRLHKERFVDNFDIAVSDLLVQASQTVMMDFVAGGGDKERDALVRSFLLFSISRGRYDQIRLLDTSGNEVIRVNYNNGHPNIVQTDGLQNKSDRYYFKETIKLPRGAVYVSPMDLNVEQERVEVPYKPVIRFSTPVHDASGKKYGLLVLNYLGENILNNLRTRRATSQGSMLLLDSDGYYLFGAAPEDLWGFMFEDGKQKRFGVRNSEAWKSLSSRESGQFVSSSGLYTFNTMYPLFEGWKSSIGTSPIAISGNEAPLDIKSYAWKLVSHIPATDMALLRRNLLIEFSELSVIFFIPLLLGSWLLARSGVRRDATETEQRRVLGELKETLEEMGLLRELLPICSLCETVRDDAGYRLKVKSFMKGRGSAKLSTGLCSNCAAKVLKKR